jgi:hypothetical protein
MTANNENNDYQPKLIYLARRNPSLTRSEFVLRWRQHAALGMSKPRWRNIARYVHCDVLSLPQPVGDITHDFDAIGMIWHRSPAARIAHLADSSSRLQMEQDEAQTFAEPIVNDCLVAREHVLQAPSEVDAGTVKLTRFWHGAAVDAVDRSTAPQSDLSRVQREVRGHVVNRPLAPERGSAWGLSCTVVEEIWFADAAAALASLAQIAANEPAGMTTTVLTNEVLLYRN